MELIDIIPEFNFNMRNIGKFIQTVVFYRRIIFQISLLWRRALLEMVVISMEKSTVLSLVLV